MFNRFFLAVAFLSLLCPTHVFAQRAVGVSWKAPTSTQIAETQLRDFANTGISYLLVDQKLDRSTWQTISSLNFTVYAMMPVRFPVVQTFSQADSIFNRETAAYLSHFSNKSVVKAVGIFAYGQTENSRFRNSVKKFLADNVSGLVKPIFYQTTQADSSPIDSLFSFKILSVSTRSVPQSDFIGAYLYKPGDKTKWDLSPVKTFLEQTVANDSIPVFFDGSWLQTMQQKHPGFQHTLTLFTSSADPAFTLPQPNRIQPSGHNSVIIALLLAWIIFAITYHNNPAYRKSLVRYFTGHQFYVDDVMQRLIRSSTAGFSILVQHAIAGGIFFYCLFYVSFSPLGTEALFNHYPFLSLLGTGGVSIFCLGFLGTFILQAIGIIWLRIANPEITYFSQILNLYTWPLQLNLLFATLLLTLFLAGQNSSFIYLVAFVFIIIMLGTFVITALDSSRNTASKRMWVLAGTAGVYSAIIIGVIIWVAASPTFLNVIKLAASLPK